MRYPHGSIEQRLLANDTEALTRVVRWIAETLSAPRYWRLRADWVDLQQEIMLRVVRSLRAERFDSTRDFESYVRGISRFTALDALALRRRYLVEEPPQTEAVPSQDDTVEQQTILRELVRRVLDTASEDCRQLIRLYFLEGGDYRQIADTLGVPEGTVKSRLFRCLRRAHSTISRVSGKQPFRRT